MKKLLKNKILIVNDDPVQLRILATHLERSGKDVIACAGGEEALRKLREIESVDLIITDLYMPGIDGWKLCRLLRSLEFPDFNKIPILVMSATFSGSDAEDITRELGANGFVSVPYNPEILRSTIENILLGKAEQKDLRILVVEDSDSLRETICEGLKEYGYSVFEASNGNQACGLFEEVNPEVVILDYHLPEHDGAKLLAAFKSPQRQAAVLVTTGDANPELAMKVSQMGADAFVRKPFNIGYLVDLCEKIRREWSLLRVEKLLEDRTLELRRILDTSVDGIVISDSSDFIVQINNSVEAMLGYRRDEIVGKHMWELMPQDNGYHEVMKDLKKKETIRGVEQVWKRKDGRLLHVEVNFSVIKDIKSNATGSLACIRDVTDKKKVEKEVREAKDFLEKVIETIGDGLLICDEKGQILSVNTAMEEMCACKREEIIGQHTSMFTQKEDKQLRETILKRTAELFEKGNVSYESVYKKKDGSVLEVECNNAMIRDDDGNYIAGVSIFRDISERKKAAKEIGEAKEFLESVIENSRDGIIISDAKGNILSANAAMEDMTGLKKESLIGEHSSMFVIEDEAMRKMIFEKMPELFKKGSISYEAIHKRNDGSWIDVECNSSLVKDNKGNPIAGVSIIRDITARKKMEKRILQSEKLSSLGELAGGVAHNFNNILAIILGRTQLLKRIVELPTGKHGKRKSMNDLKKSLEIIEKASFDGADTVRRIHEFSRRKDDNKNITEVDLNEVIEYALKFTKARWKNEAGAKGIKINIQKELSCLSPIEGSGSELREVFINIVNNAIDAMPKGGQVSIKTFMDNSHVMVWVKDSGIGIPKNVRDRIFDPFFTTKGVQSTGLGMSASYGIINRHRGTITVDSVEGQGTTFSIKFPKLERGIDEREKSIANEQHAISILVVEDEKGVRELLKDILVDGGYTVEVAPNGEKGIQLFQEKKCNLVFTDLGMPGMSGWQVAEEIKKMNEKTKVALVTGWEVDMNSHELKKCGVDWVIQKPFQMNQILGSVKEMMKDNTPMA